MAELLVTHCELHISYLVPLTSLLHLVTAWFSGIWIMNLKPLEFSMQWKLEVECKCWASKLAKKWTFATNLALAIWFLFCLPPKSFFKSSKAKNDTNLKLFFLRELRMAFCFDSFQVINCLKAMPVFFNKSSWPFSPSLARPSKFSKKQFFKKSIMYEHVPHPPDRTCDIGWKRPGSFVKVVLCMNMFKKVFLNVPRHHTSPHLQDRTCDVACARPHLSESIMCEDEHERWRPTPPHPQPDVGGTVKDPSAKTRTLTQRGLASWPLTESTDRASKLTINQNRQKQGPQADQQTTKKHQLGQEDDHKPKTPSWFCPLDKTFSFPQSFKSIPFKDVTTLEGTGCPF